MEQFFKNKHLIIVPIDDDYYGVLNPLIKNGLRVLNSKQIKVLEKIEEIQDVKGIAELFSASIEEAEKCIKILQTQEFILKHPNFTKENPQPHSLNFWIHTTNQCNLRCSYCNIPTLGENSVLEDKNIEILFDKIISSCKQWHLSKVSLRLAGGEPLLKFKIWKEKILNLRKRLNDINVSLQVSFLTNLIALNDEIINFIKDEKIGIGISLDGLNIFQDSTRRFENGNGSFHIVSKNLDRLLSAGITPGIMTVVSNGNLDGLVELTKFIIAKRLHFRYSFVQGVPLDIEKTSEKLNLCYEEFETAIKNEDYPFIQKHTLCDLKFLNPFFQTCSNGFSGGAIYTNGDIYFCQTEFGEKQPIGSIFSELDLITTIQKGNHYGTLNNECFECNYLKICTGGCPLERDNGKDPHCVLYKEFIPKIIRLMGMQKLIAVNKYQ